MDFSQTVLNELNQFIFKFAEKISETHNIDINATLKIWCDINNVDMSTCFSAMIKEFKKQKKTEEIKDIDENLISTIIEEEDEEKTNNDEIKNVALNETPTNSDQCQYIFTRGPKKGQRCTITSKNKNYCSKHKSS